MSKKIIVVTPHPDDETLGCGGTILKHRFNEDEVYWLIITKMGSSFSKESIQKRQDEINKVKELYDFIDVYELGFEAAALETIPNGSLISSIGNIFKKVNPHIIYVPYPSDIHSDHKIVFDASMACTKWFRYPSVEKVLVYETLSETDFTINPDANTFRPNVFVDISDFLQKKLDIMKVYESELAEYPFPRSLKAIESLAYIRGTASGFEAAESFMLLKERIV